jgi:cytidine deaminase
VTDSLEARAHAARARAYAPYSGYRVGAALETDDGRVFEGCNVENASYSVTCCAERVALYSAVAAGARSFRRLVVVAGGPTPHPCGACRQALSELAPDDLPITVVADGGGHHRFTLGELLPKPFRMEPERS